MTNQIRTRKQVIYYVDFLMRGGLNDQTELVEEDYSVQAITILDQIQKAGEESIKVKNAKKWGGIRSL